MELRTNDEIISDPTAADITTIVSVLGGRDNHFAILELKNMTYLQTSNWDDLGFFLEYQEGSVKNHYRTVFNLTSNQVTQAFLWYLRGDKRWLSAFVWTRIDVKGVEDSGTDSREEKRNEKELDEAEMTVKKALELFGLKQGATKEQLQRQYREMISKCHPDRVNHLDSAFQQLAEEKTKHLNRAYSLLGKIMSM